VSSFVRGESMLFVISSEPYMRLWVYYTTDYYICYLYMIFLSIHLCFVFCYYRISLYTKNQTRNTLNWTFVDPLQGGPKKNLVAFGGFPFKVLGIQNGKFVRKAWEWKNSRDFVEWCNYISSVKFKSTGYLQFVHFLMILAWAKKFVKNATKISIFFCATHMPKKAPLQWVESSWCQGLLP